MVYNYFKHQARGYVYNCSSTPPFFLVPNKYVSSVVHHGRPAGERGFYTPKTRFVNLSIYPKSKFTKHEE